jgi:hypothetical protein
MLNNKIYFLLNIIKDDEIKILLINNNEYIVFKTNMKKTYFLYNLLTKNLYRITASNPYIYSYVNTSERKPTWNFSYPPKNDIWFSILRTFIIQKFLH